MPAMNIRNPGRKETKEEVFGLNLRDRGWQIF